MKSKRTCMPQTGKASLSGLGSQNWLSETHPYRLHAWLVRWTAPGPTGLSAASSGNMLWLYWVWLELYSYYDPTPTPATFSPEAGVEVETAYLRTLGRALGIHSLCLGSPALSVQSACFCFHQQHEPCLWPFPLTDNPCQINFI